MALPPARTEISDNYPLPSDATARIGFGRLYDYVTGLLGATGNKPEALAALGAYGKTNIIGTVSQSGGVPTGAIIETGTNASGRYTKYACGRMVCERVVSLTPGAWSGGAVKYSVAGSANHAATYIAAPVLSLSSSDNDVAERAASIVTFYSTTTQVNDIYIISRATTPTTTPITINIVSMGRWYA